MPSLVLCVLLHTINIYSSFIDSMTEQCHIFARCCQSHCG